MTISAHPSSRPQQWSPEEKYRFLSTILESFAGTLDLQEALRRIVNITREHFAADRVLLIHPVRPDAQAAVVRYSVSAAHVPVVLETGSSTILTKTLIQRAFDSARPVTVLEGDPEANVELAKTYQVRSALFQILSPQGDDPWVFGMHQ